MVLLGIRPYEGFHYNLGRETFLVPIVWEKDGWPRLDNENGLVQVSLKTEGNEDVREKLFYACAENQCPILRMENTHVSLEDIFLELTSQDSSEAKNTGASSDADAIQSLMEDTETPEEENKEGGQE